MEIYGSVYKEDISIHAPREGGDAGRTTRLPDKSGISIHAPREGGDLSFLPP